MKINRLIEFKNKLLKLKLIKTKTYKNLNFFDNIKIETTEFKLKKALNVIYRYHMSNKQILFVGTPFKLDKKLKYLLKNTKHVVIPSFSWVNGLIRNQSSTNNDTKVSKILFQLKQTPDLIVILNKTPNSTVLEESYKTKISTISLNCCLTNDECTYKIPGNFNFKQKQVNTGFFYSILAATLKKSVQNQKIRNKYKKCIA